MGEQERRRRRASRPRRKSLYEQVSETPDGAAELEAARFTCIVDWAVQTMLDEPGAPERVRTALNMSEGRLEEILAAEGIMHTSTLAKIASVCQWSLSLRVTPSANQARTASATPTAATTARGLVYAQRFMGPEGSEYHTYKVDVGESHFPAGEPELVLENSGPSRAKVERYAGSVRKQEAVYQQ